jgi:hypothetical protein
VSNRQRQSRRVEAVEMAKYLTLILNSAHFSAHRPQEIEEVACGPRQSIEPGDHQHIRVCESRHRAHELVASGFNWRSD